MRRPDTSDTIMTDHGKKNILGIDVSAVDFGWAVDTVIRAARDRRSLKVSALAVHGVMTGVLDPHHRWRLNGFDVVTPDGQPVRWALRLLHRIPLYHRVDGPTLMLKVCARAERERLPIYLYGSKPDVLEELSHSLQSRFPDLVISGMRPSLFRRSTDAEKQSIADEIAASGARIVFVGLGCPRQEVFVHEYAGLISCPALAVGAAFDFHAGRLRPAPSWMQDCGLEWVFRLAQEPRRLWRRYLYLNPLYLALFAAQAIRPDLFRDRGVPPDRQENFA